MDTNQSLPTVQQPIANPVIPTAMPVAASVTLNSTPVTINSEPPKETKKEKNTFLIVVIILVIIVGLLSVFIAYNLLNLSKTANTSEINNGTNNTELSYTTNTTTVTPTSFSTPESYKQIVPTGWYIGQEVPSQLMYALPKQDGNLYVAKNIPDVINEATTPLWYIERQIQTPNVNVNNPDSIIFYKTPGGYDRLKYTCSTSPCITQSYIQINYKPSTQTTEDLFLETKTGLEQIQAAAKSTDPIIANSQKITKWGQTVYKYTVNSFGTLEDHYIVGTGKVAYFINYSSPSNDPEVIQVFDSLVLGANIQN